MSLHRQQMIGRIVNAYMGSVTGAREAHMNDAIYHERVEFMTRLLEIFDLAMDQENIPQAMRLRVLERVMLAAPDPGETKRLLEQAKKLISPLPNHWKMDWQ